MRIRWHKDLVGGGALVLVGILVVSRGLTYEAGTLSRMGPGYFPVALGAILALSGLAIAVTGWFATPPAETMRAPPQWRAWFLVCVSIVAFIVLAAYLGLVPATFAIVFISALADRDNSLKDALALSLAMVAICIVVFWWLLQVDLPLFRWG